MLCRFRQSCAGPMLSNFMSADSNTLAAGHKPARCSPVVFPQVDAKFERQNRTAAVRVIIIVDVTVNCWFPSHRLAVCSLASAVDRPYQLRHRSRPSTRHQTRPSPPEENDFQGHVRGRFVGPHDQYSEVSLVVSTPGNVRRRSLSWSTVLAEPIEDRRRTGTRQQCRHLIAMLRAAR